MKKYCKIVNDENKLCNIGLGSNINFYSSIGMQEMDVEQAYDGNWYLSGYVPQEPEPTYVEKRLNEYPSIGDQLDMIYWDQINNTQKWQEKITKIKNKYPKE